MIINNMTINKDAQIPICLVPGLEFLPNIIKRNSWCPKSKIRISTSQMIQNKMSEVLDIEFTFYHGMN